MRIYVLTKVNTCAQIKNVRFTPEEADRVMRLLGIIDLAKRWKYTKQGAHQKIKCDENFPKPIVVINKNTMVFLEEEIMSYEQERKELTDSDYKRWHIQKGGSLKKK